MQIKRLENKDIKVYKETLKKYIGQLMLPYTHKNINNEINRIYSNMCTFTQDRTAIILGAIENNDLIGFIWGYRKKEENNIFHINYFFVNEKYRSQGTGSMLLKEFENKISKYKEIELLVNKNNVGALEFYKRNGFKIKEEMHEDIKLYKISAD